MGAKPDHGGASRQEKKAKKRKLEAAIPDVPGDDEVDVPEVDAPEKSSKKRKKEHKKSEEKAEVVKEDAQDGAKAGEDAVMADISAAIADAPRKSKKERKAERKAAEAAAAAAEAEKSKSEDVDESEKKQKKKGGNQTESSEQKDGQEKSAKKKSKKEKKPEPEAGAEEADDEKADGLGSKGEAKAARFIVFIGNLPFTATKESIEKHFAKVKPASVRPLSDKKTGKPKGCAFVEFDGYDHMKTVLSLYHHSTFDDGLSPARKINVELTAGGGGKTKRRQAKIGEKNEKLNAERIRKIQEEAKRKNEKKSEAGAAGAAIDTSSVHPSRRNIVPDR